MMLRKCFDYGNPGSDLIDKERCCQSREMVAMEHIAGHHAAQEVHARSKLKQGRRPV